MFAHPLTAEAFFIDAFFAALVYVVYARHCLSFFVPLAVQQASVTVISPNIKKFKPTILIVLTFDMLNVIMIIRSFQYYGLNGRWCRGEV